MKQDWTKEPLKIGTNTSEFDTYNANIVSDSEGNGVCMVFDIALNITLREAETIDRPDDIKGLATAKRIIATYNACQGLSDEDLKLVKYIDDFKALTESIKESGTRICNYPEESKRKHAMVAAFNETDSWARSILNRIEKGE